MVQHGTGDGSDITALASPTIVRGKLLSCSTDSRASDSGISAEFSELPACNGNSNTTTVVENGDTEAATDTEEAAKRPCSIPNLSKATLSIDSVQSPAQPIAPCNSGVLGVVPSGTHSTIDTTDAPSAHATKSDIGSILESLIEDHRKKDDHWEPSGRYHSDIAQLEVGIGKKLSKKQKAREDARKVLELFLESSLNADPDFKPSGHYKKPNKLGEPRTSTKRDVTSAETSPTETVPIIYRGSPAGPAPRSLSPIQQEESAAERGSDVSALHNQRHSYYNAVHEDDSYRAEDECYDEIDGIIPELTYTLEHNIRLASVESGEFSPISLIPLEPTTTEDSAHGQYARTTVESTEQGIHIHRHTVIERPLSSSTSLSSILDDGGGSDLQLKDRRKKSFFKRATQRLQHVFHRSARSVERSESRSESEADKHSVTRRTPKRRKRRGFSIGKKKGDPEIVDTKILESHQHHLRLDTTAHVSSAGAGLNEQLWREEKGPGGVVEKGKSSTLPTLHTNGSKSSRKTEKEKEKAKERWQKGVNDLMKEGRNARKPNRSESSRSNDSMFKFLNVKKSFKGESPKVDRRGKSSFSLKRWKKKNHTDINAADVREALSSDSPRAQGPPADGLLHPPIDQTQQQRSKSAEEITPPFTDLVAQGPTGNSLRLTPQHSRSRSAHDTSDPFYTVTANGSSTSSQQPSSSPTKRPAYPAENLSAQSLSPSTHKRKYVPRSTPVKQNSLGSPRVHSRRHTTQVTDRVELSGGIASAGMGLSHSSISRNVTLDLPVSVDANISRTQSLNTRKDGSQTLKTVTSLDEMVSLNRRGSSRKKNRMSEVETDSEIEKIIHIPQSERTQTQKDELYRHIASKISRLVTVMESDDGLSSSYGTPMDDKRFQADSVPSVPIPGSAQSSTYVTARSSSSSPTYKQLLDLSKSGKGVISGTFSIQDTSEGGQAMDDVTEDTAVTKTDIAELGAYFRTKGDLVYASNPHLGSSLGNYKAFAELADDVTNNQLPFFQNIAGVFSVTLSAIKAVGKTGELANKVKENALTYIEDKFANYIIGNGGWDSMLEESNSEID